MMSHKSPSIRNFEILCDSLSKDGQFAVQDRPAGASSRSQPLRHLSVCQAQNRQPEPLLVDTSVNELNQAARNSSWADNRENSKGTAVVSRRIRPSLTSNTFELPNAVAKPEPSSPSGPAASGNSEDAQQLLKIEADKSTDNLNHSKSVAARKPHSLKQQVAKHRDGQFDWILAVNLPGNTESERDIHSGADTLQKSCKAYFGCNLVAESPPENKSILKNSNQTDKHMLLVTSVAETKEVLEIFRGPVINTDMATLEPPSDRRPLAVASNHGHVPQPREDSPHSSVCTRGYDSGMESVASRSPGKPVIEIKEDPLEALDILEDELEAFGKFAHFGQYIPTKKQSSIEEHSIKAELAPPSLSVRFATPQPQRTLVKPSPASLRAQSVSEPKRAALRKATSMNLDPYRYKAEIKTTTHLSPQIFKSKGTTSYYSQTLKSPKQHVIPTFELFGEGAGREPKDKRDVRLAAQRATQPTASSLRRAKSLKQLTQPTFELPGEAISRRKREEHQAQLKAQAEEEKKRREFKARPPPPQVVPTTVPRDTVASRARQNRTALTENAASHAHTPKNRPFSTIGPHSRPLLSSAINQSQPRGRGLKVETASGPRDTRATSASTSSTSEKRSPLSTEDVQMQKLRGHEIYQRDHSWVDSRMREKYERETLAKLAREEAAEKSRQKSREWASRQLRKRITIGSLRDVMV